MSTKLSSGLLALGRLKTGELNKTEMAYQNHLELLRIAGDILWYRFESIKLVLPGGVFYMPDFFVLNSNNEFEAHEVKGYWIGDAKTKIRIAAGLYPFKFITAHLRPKKDGGGFDVEVVA